MADSLANRIKELDEVYKAVSASSETFGSFLRSKLTKDALKKCNITSVDLRYVTIQPETQLFSFSDHWQSGITSHVYSARYDDPVLLPKVAESETSCVRLFATTKPLRVLSVQRNSLLELCKKWVREHYEGSNNTSSNGEEGTSSPEDADLLPAIPRNLFQRKDGVSILDYALYSERSSNFHDIEGVAFDEPASSASASPSASSRHLLLFGTDAVSVQQELVYPSKKKLRKGADGFLSCVSEPSRPQAPPMKRGKSVNTPPIHSPASAPPPPPPYQPKTSPLPAPRPSTPTLTDEKGEGKPPPKPQAPPRESFPIYSTPNKPSVDYSSDEAAKLELENNTQM